MRESLGDREHGYAKANHGYAKAKHARVTPEEATVTHVKYVYNINRWVRRTGANIWQGQGAETRKVTPGDRPLRRCLLHRGEWVVRHPGPAGSKATGAIHLRKFTYS